MRPKRAGAWASAASWRDALEIEDSDHIALMGGGGKTTTMWSLARELSQRGPTVVTSTTKAGEVPGDVPLVAWAGELPGHDLHAAVNSAWKRAQLIALTDGKRERRLEGVSPIVVDEVFFRCGASYIINEADGARMKPFKAPANDEPVIASTTTLGVILLGLDALGAAIDEEHVHRPEKLVAATGAKPGAPLTAANIAIIIAVYLQRLDFLQSERAAVIINKTDDGPEDPRVAELVAAIRELDVAAVIAASQRGPSKLWKLT